MSQTQHTPGPWVIQYDDETVIVGGPWREKIATTLPRSIDADSEATKLEIANAAFIVEAVNSHAALLAERDALREALEVAVRAGRGLGSEWRLKARAALALSQVKP